MMEYFLRFILLVGFSCMLHDVVAYSSGAPPSEYYCRTLKPGHGYKIQTGPSPYTIAVSQSCYKPGDRIKVEITTTGDQYKGYYVQARSGFDDSKAYGTFSVGGSGMKLNNCFNSVHNAITHSSSADKTSVFFYWIPKSGDKAPIKFTATVVKDIRTYWVGLTSKSLEYDVNCGSTTTIPSTSTTTTTTTTTTSTTEQSTTTMEPSTNKMEPLTTVTTVTMEPTTTITQKDSTKECCSCNQKKHNGSTPTTHNVTTAVQTTTTVTTTTTSTASTTTTKGLHNHDGHFHCCCCSCVQADDRARAYSTSSQLRSKTETLTLAVLFMILFFH